MSELRVSVVIATRDRRASLLRSLARLDEPAGPPVVVVDNGSADGTVAAVRATHPRVEVLALAANAGAVARTHGVQRATTPYVAFADDDSWWEPGALETAADLLDAHPDVAVVVGRVRMARDGSEDAVTRKHRAAVLGRSAAGPDVLSFPAFAAVVRRDAHLAVGGFSPLLFFGGEEHLLALDLAAAGWQLVFSEDVVAWHDPAGPDAPSTARWALQTRNDVLVDWLRRPLPVALAATGRLARRATADAAARRALAGVLRRLPAAVRQRRPVPARLEQRFATALRPLG
ncbi:glycosyltransferase family 2 protein [Modestobacter sp. VKM Ac-2984]|uniref:glycosyltransferase family 2 protein n=1 Tax=Modestobacter sp. VKM Ac-2984 TaxID=3004138 RepID=UPI0022AA929B|nr:glycosyltransferase family 2 protein [Modestobacter sp. VKM Ac-2984]MCZ2816513.1 glycosyltransferase [Modestobacter sp. VKM Ac-2984]